MNTLPDPTNIPDQPAATGYLHPLLADLENRQIPRLLLDKIQQEIGSRKAYINPEMITDTLLTGMRRIDPNQENQMAAVVNKLTYFPQGVYPGTVPTTRILAAGESLSERVAEILKRCH